jgi:hypothetical protein
MDFNIIIFILIFSIGIIIGWVLAIFRISKDEQFVRLNADEVVCKKPPENHILVAVSPEMARRLVYTTEKQYDQTEMRNLRRNT